MHTDAGEPRVFWFLHVHSGGALRMTVRTLAVEYAGVVWREGETARKKALRW